MFMSNVSGNKHFHSGSRHLLWLSFGRITVYSPISTLSVFTAAMPMSDRYCDVIRKDISGNIVAAGAEREHVSFSDREARILGKGKTSRILLSASRV